MEIELNEQKKIVFFFLFFSPIRDMNAISKMRMFWF